jgi:NADPH:quinone reductase-like Zn-dependent oxidoreductase
MKAAQFSRFGGPEVLEIVELPDPQAGPGEIRIAVRAPASTRATGRNVRA